MKNNLIRVFLLVFLFSFQTKAQYPIEKEIIGTWKVEAVDMLIDKIQPDQKEKLDMLNKAFLTSTFVFKADRNFTFDFQFKELQVKKGHWKYNNETKSMIIQDWKDKDTDAGKLMEVKIRKENDKLYFLVVDTFFELEMKKASK